MKPKIRQRKKIGLALGGGGARGCAHIGVIKALEEAGISIDCVSGTSIGSLIGGVYAAGGLEKLEEILLKIRWKDVVKYFDPVLPTKGFFEGKKVVKLLKTIIPTPFFRSLRISYVAIATDLLSGKEIAFENGNVINAIRASISIPGIFTPAIINKKYLVDGGLVNPMPVDAARRLGADIVIGVDLNHNFLNEKRQVKKAEKHQKIPLKARVLGLFSPDFPTIIDVIENSTFKMQDQLTQKNLLVHPPDFLIRPHLGSAGLFDFHKAKEMIDEGYRQTKKIIPQIKKLI